MDNNLISITKLIDFIFIITLFFTGCLTKYFLFQNPNHTLFDETHFGNFTNSYLANEFFIDVHPPTAKLIIAFLAKVSGYNGTTVFGPNNIHTDPYFLDLRFIVISFSSLVPSLIYLACRFWNISPLVSFCVGIALATDPVINIEGSYLLTDGILHAFVSMAIFAISYLETHSSYFHIFLASVCIGLAFSTKYTALSLTVVIASQQFFKLINGNILNLFKPQVATPINDQEDPEDQKNYQKILIFELLSRGLLIFISAVSVLFISYGVHVVVIKYRSKTELDKITNDYERTLMYRFEKDKSRNVVSIGLLKRIWLSIFVIHHKNMQATALTGFESYWYQWPTVNIKLFEIYARQYRFIWYVPNPLVWIPAFIGPILLTSYIILKIKKTRYWRDITWPIGYASSLFPFMLVPRTTYEYHYIIPLIFGVISFGVFIERILSPLKRSTFSILFIIASFIFGIFFLPVSTAMPNTMPDSRIWKESLSYIYCRDDNYRLPTWFNYTLH